MYNKYILVTLIPLPGLPILLPHQLPLLSTNFPPTIMGFCFLLCKPLSLIRTTCLGMGAGIWASYLHHWKQRCPLCSVAPERWARPHEPFPHPRQNVTGLVSCKLCAGNHSSCEFMGTMAMSFPEDNNSWLPSQPFGFCILSAPLVCDVACATQS